MGQIETPTILDEIESLVSDKLQVVSYKWLSRNFLVSSNAAKRLLQEFVGTHRSDLEVVYTLSGWLKNNPPCYHIRLVSWPKLEEAKQEFDGNCSVHVYSVQAAIPKDPAALWNDEFVQAEELFKQPSAVDNCLRDNRFCSILNPSIKRNVVGTPMSNAASQPKSVGILGPSKSNSAHESNILRRPQQIKVEQSSPKVDQQCTNLIKDIKSESNGTEGNNQASKPSADREKLQSEKKGQNAKISTGSGGSLANLWSRASTKSKHTSAPADNCSHIINATASAEAQIFAHEVVEDRSSDDEAQDVNFKRAFNGEGGRKRRVVFDFSDDESEDAISLSSPDLPKGKTSKTLLPLKPNVNDQTDDKPKVKYEKSTDRASNQVLRENSSVASKSINSGTSSEENILNCISGDDVKADIVTNATPDKPKRRKVLKTCIDERGREVNEVVWEGEEAKTEKADTGTTKKAETNAISTTVNNRAPSAKKSPTIGNTAPSNPGGKGGNKKGGSKDPKQGNILSFFKRA